MADPSNAPEHDPDAEHGTIHVVERGDSWEVWRVGDSMPLGTYVTRGEADEQAEAVTAEIGSEPVHDDLGLSDEEAGIESSDAEVIADAAGGAPITGD